MCNKNNLLKHFKGKNIEVSLKGNDLIFTNPFQKKNYILNKNIFNIHLKENIDENKFKDIILNVKSQILNKDDENSKGILSLFNKITNK